LRKTAANAAEDMTQDFAQGQQGDANASGASVKMARFAQLESGPVAGGQNTLDLLLDVQLELSVELGRATMPVRDVLHLGPGSVVELNKLGGEPVDILVNGRPIARGEVVVVDENFGVRITEIISRPDASVHSD
jgi:flagellar motor switch protein FliN/FliY